MKHLRLIFLLSVFFVDLEAQTFSEEAKIFNSLKLDGGVPANLLASRAALFYDLAIPESDLQAIQNAFQQTGIDAVVYFETARSMAGADARRVAAKYLVKRNISFLIFIRKMGGEYEFYITTFNNKPDFIEAAQSAWFVHGNGLNGVLRTIFQTMIGTEKKQNFLINDLPEHVLEKEASAVVGRRNETLVVDIAYFSVAFPKFGDEKADQELEQYLKENYTGKYELVDAATGEIELRKRNFLYVARYVHTQGALAKSVLGYESPKTESAIASAVYVNGELQVKTNPSDAEVYKFYFKKLEDESVFLGKWDADTSWQQALKNHINAYKAEKKLK